jgi:hypothetical protein
MPKQDKQPVVEVVPEVVVDVAPPAEEPIVLPAVVHFALDVIDRGHATAFGALHDARTEIRVAVESGLDLADKASAAALRFARKIVVRTDELVAETLSGAQRVLSTSVATARSSAVEAAAR